MATDLTCTPDLVMLNLEAAQGEDAIAQLGSKLVAAGFATPAYVEGVINRERSFPTAIEFPTCNVAIPHGEPDEVIASAVAVGLCRPPVPFHLMNDFDKTANVSLVVMLAVKHPEAHLEVLSRIINALSDEATCQSLLKAQDKALVARILESITKEVPCA